MKHPNEHIKVVEIDGFVINPRNPHLVGTPQDKENEGARECAGQLKKHLPLGAELIIL